MEWQSCEEVGNCYWKCGLSHQLTLDKLEKKRMQNWIQIVRHRGNGNFVHCFVQQFQAFLLQGHNIWTVPLEMSHLMLQPLLVCHLLVSQSLIIPLKQDYIILLRRMQAIFARLKRKQKPGWNNAMPCLTNPPAHFHSGGFPISGRSRGDQRERWDVI